MPKELAVLPKHLHKPADAIDIYKRYDKVVAAAATETIIDRTNNENKRIEIIPAFNNENLFATVEYHGYVNDSQIFWFQTATQGMIHTMEMQNVYNYLRRNPIKLKPGDTLRIDCKNNSAAAVGIALHIMGWSYFDDEGAIPEETPPGEKIEGEEVEVET